MVATWEGKVKSRHLKKNIDCMVLKLLFILEMSFLSLIIQKPGEIPIFIFFAKFSILAYISPKIRYFELG